MMKFWGVLVVLFLPVESQRPVVTIKDGTLVGIPMVTWMGRKISAFMSVPYAAPPVGKLRFMPPQPVVSWNSSRDAGINSPKCLQYRGTSSPNIGVEDCLYLNVYTPQLPTYNSQTNGSLPVLVFFHPGAFMMGTGDEFGPRYLLDHNMLLVSPNYRLGILGFLSTGEGTVPGNMGLKDQVAAIQWVRRNIANFGGNPNDITIAGGSAGASSVQYHFMSPMSRGLFKRGIAMSGSVLVPFAQQKASQYKMQTISRRVNCLQSSIPATVNCLRARPADELVSLEGIFQRFYYNPFAPFGPVVEQFGSSPFLTDSPYELLRTGQIADLPLIISTVTHEGLVPVSDFIANNSALSTLNTDWLSIAPYLLDYIFTVPINLRNSTGMKIREFYLGNETISSRTTPNIVTMVGDRIFTNDVETAARLQAYVNKAPVYYYLFGYRGQRSQSDLLSGTTNNYGVSHGDDSFYILNSTYISEEGRPRDREMILRMSNMWASFVTTGVPNIGTTWTPLFRNNSMTGPLNYLTISSPTDIRMNSTSSLGHIKFWDSLPIMEPGSGRPIL